MRTKMKTMGGVSGAVVLFAVAMAVQANTKNDSTAAIEKLLKQRKDTLQRLLEVTIQKHIEGKAEPASIFRVSGQLTNVELELAKGNKERVALFQRQVNLMEEVLAMAERQHRTKRATLAETLEARAALLQARIDLEREIANSDSSRR